MATTRAIITRALKELRVIAPGETADADDVSDALDKLNGIMHGLETEGLTYEHTSLTLNDDFPFDDNLHNAAIMWLTMHIAGLFGRELTAKQAMDGMAGEEAIIAAYYTVPDSSFDTALYRLPGNRRYWSTSG